jgi:hypothetical protein
LLKNLGFDSPEWQDLGRLLAALLVLATLGGAAWTQWERRQHDPWLRLLEQARRKLAQTGIPVPAHAAPRQMAALVPHHPALQSWLLQLESLRYAPHSPGSLAALRKAFKRLVWRCQCLHAIADNPPFYIRATCTHPSTRQPSAMCICCANSK